MEMEADGEPEDGRGVRLPAGFGKAPLSPQMWEPAEGVEIYRAGSDGRMRRVENVVKKTETKCDDCGKVIDASQPDSINTIPSQSIQTYGKPGKNGTVFLGHDFCNAQCLASAILKPAMWVTP